MIASSKKYTTRIGILVHGRHLETKNWEEIVWGKPPTKLGSLPMMVLVALHRGVENIAKVVFGSGASEKDGLKESEYILRYLKNKMARIGEFDHIRNHPRFESYHDLQLLGNLMNTIECQKTSKNTMEEIADAAKVFSKAGIADVIEITCASHAPRCIRDQAVAFEQGLIPQNQLWSIVHGMTTYAHTTAEEVVIIEPPHRGDDPMAKSKIKTHEIFSKLFYDIRETSVKIKTLRAIKTLVEKAVRD